MKKIINDPNDVVEQMLKGIEVSNPDVRYDPEGNVIVRKHKTQKVALVSGGGSGHEPAHAGYVGYGMLDAAVSGNVFASPSPDQVLKGIQLANSGNGVLLIIKNYAGDIMNFEIAQELAEMEDIEVDSVVVKDDVSVKDQGDSTGRRGIAGTVFVHKIAGAKAETGAELSEVKRVAQKVIDNVRSFGVSLSPCTIPAVGTPGFAIADDEMEVGMGIHGEAGIETTKIKPSHEIAELIVDKILADKDFTNSEVAVMVNGMGATPLMELYILAGDVEDVLKERGIHSVNYFVGNYMTAIEMAGASVSLLKLDDELKEYITELDASTGDGDHWVNIHKGFEKIVELSDQLENLSLSDMFKKVGMTLFSAVGGSSGALYGSGYIAMSKACKDIDALDIHSFYTTYEAMLKEMMKRGKTEPGQKTMIDALYSALVAYKKAIDQGLEEKEVIEAFVQGGNDGAQATKAMEAVKGRASYRTDKGVGHLDPGAVTMAMQLESIGNLILNK